MGTPVMGERWQRLELGGSVGVVIGWALGLAVVITVAIAVAIRRCHALICGRRDRRRVDARLHVGDGVDIRGNPSPNIDATEAARYYCR